MLSIGLLTKLEQIFDKSKYLSLEALKQSLKVCS